MPLVEQTFLKPGKYRVGFDADRKPIWKEFTAADLKERADNTRKMLEAGIPVPVFPKHTKIGSPEGDPQRKEDARDNLGWLVDMKQKADGSAVHVLDIADAETARKIESGSIKFTSPEFQDNYTDSKGREFGKIIRHVALTATPRVPDQGPFEAVALSEDVYQFSMDDHEDTVQLAADDPDSTGGGSPPPFQKSGEDDASQAQNPDMMGDDASDKKSQAIVALLSELGIELPSDFDLKDGIDSLLAALKTRVASERKAKEDKQADRDGDDDGESTVKVEQPPMGTQFTEDAKQEIGKRDEKLASYYRKDLTAAVEGCRIPALRKKLASMVETVQFDDEGQEQPLLSVTQVVEMVNDCLPKTLQFADDDSSKEGGHPDGEAFFRQDGERPTGEEAAKIAEEFAQETGIARPTGTPFGQEKEVHNTAMFAG